MKKQRTQENERFGGCLIHALEKGRFPYGEASQVCAQRKNKKTKKTKDTAPC